MANTDDQNISPAAGMADTLKSWVMVVLSFIFILAYVTVVIVNWADSKNATDAIKELQPIVFGIIGYYFGRLPAQQTENALQGQVNTATVKKDEAVEQKAAVEEKIKAAKIALGAVSSESSIAGAGPMTAVPDRKAVEIAMKLMDS